MPKDPAFTVANSAVTPKLGNSLTPGAAEVDSTEDRYNNRAAENFTNMVWRSVKRFGAGVTNQFIFVWYCDMPDN